MAAYLFKSHLLRGVWDDFYLGGREGGVRNSNQGLKSAVWP
jgi:hypothetical protein